MAKKQYAAPVPSVPAGTVTFLFTDIEGSTKLWEAHGDAMRVALARHDALLRQYIAAHGGHVFKTVGDAFCAAFATAGDALGAALAAQQALHAEPWAESARIRARMALHTGAAELRDGDYFGAPLNHVARLLAAGHGGQTLLSEITRDLCRDRAPAGATLKSLGEHSLRDLARRETVFQLCHPDLPQAFPPLKTLLASFDENVPSIAVLPFVNLSRDEENEYFADGLAEELLNVLSKIRGLRVASRTSAFSFKGKDVDIPTVAQKLNVATILEGSVRKAGNRVRITAQLIEVATDSHQWSETYDRELDDIFAVQDDIAHSVVEELRSTLFGERADASVRSALKAEMRAATKGRGENAEAHRLYLQGRFLIGRRTQADVAKGIDYCRQAVALDPRYALAWAGLAQAYSDQAGYGWAPVVDAFRQAREAAEGALLLEPDLAEGHLARGWVCMYYDRDWKRADASFRRALELAPGNAEVLRGTAALAATLGRLGEAVGLLRHAVSLDPLNSTAHKHLGMHYLAANLVDEADAAVALALELNPQGSFTHFWLGMVRLAQGRLDEALAAVEHEVYKDIRLCGRAVVQHARGQSEESAAALQELIEQRSEDAAYQIAEAYAYRGEVSLAFEWLERAYAQHDAGVGEVRLDLLLRNLHGDPRWQAFLEKMGLVGT